MATNYVKLNEIGKWTKCEPNDPDAIVFPDRYKQSQESNRDLIILNLERISELQEIQHEAYSKAYDVRLALWKDEITARLVERIPDMVEWLLQRGYSFSGWIQHLDRDDKDPFKLLTPPERPYDEGTYIKDSLFYLHSLPNETLTPEQKHIVSRLGGMWSD